MSDGNGTTTQFVKGHLYTLPLTSLETDPDQPRKYMDPQALDELTASVRQHGVLEPVLFRQDESGRLLVVAGERRCVAAKQAGIENIPAIYVDGNHAEIGLVENLLRQDLTPVEESEALDRIMKDHGYKQEDLSQIIGKSLSTISETLSLNRLPVEVRDECRNDLSVPKRTLVEIAKSKQQRRMVTLFKKYREKNLSRAEVKRERTGQTKSTPASIVLLLNQATEKINKLDLAGLSEADSKAIRSAVSALYLAANNKLVAAPAIQTHQSEVEVEPAAAATAKKRPKIAAP